MGKTEAYRQRQLAQMRECIAEADRQHTPTQVQQAIQRAQEDADRIMSRREPKQGILTLRK